MRFITWLAVASVMSWLVASHPRVGMASGNIPGARREQQDMKVQARGVLPT